MMYSSRFITSLKVGGKILRETNGTVSLPFGAEYSILLKNLHSRRAMVKVTVDGQDATEGTRLILPANGSIDLERFIKNGNLKAGNKFKFIERTSQIEDHRGIKEDDGLLRAEFWVEKEVVDVPVKRYHYYDEWYPVPKPYYYPYYPWNQPTITCGLGGQYNASYSAAGNIGSSQQATQGVQMMAMNCSAGATGMLRSASLQGEEQSNDAGITVPGSKSNQEFQSSWGFETESNSHVIVLQLRGTVGNKQVESAVTVDRKPVCPTCGKSNKGSHQFCSQCGTALNLI